MSDVKIKAEADYMSGMKYKDIAEKYNVSLNTVKSWKKRYAWDRSGDAKKGAHKIRSERMRNVRQQSASFRGSGESGG